MTRHVMIPWLMTFMYAQTTDQSKQMTFAHPKVFLISKTFKNYIAPENENSNYRANITKQKQNCICDRHLLYTYN